MKDRVAFAGAATTGFARLNSGKSQAALAADACIRVLNMCGLDAKDIDGICGSSPSAPVLQAALGIPSVTWFANPSIPFVNQVVAAATAVHSGLCDTVLAYHAAYRLPWNTAGALRDPFRRAGFGAAKGDPNSIAGAGAYAAWASRYIHEYGARKEHFGYIAINDRTNAAHNPAAALRTPITMDEYLSARMIRPPLNMLDMDAAVDGADAFIITTAERARDLPLPPVLIHAATLGMIDKSSEDQTPSLRQHGQHVVVEALKAKSDFWIDAADIYFPYDGFTIIALNWIENVGLCKPGEAGGFIESNWDAANSRILIGGRMPVNPHGGALAEGGTQGSGHVRDAVHQLQGLAGERQVRAAVTALITAGGFFSNAQGLALRKG